MARRPPDLAKTIDHTLLDPAPTADAVSRLCDEAQEHHFAAVCVLPSTVPAAASLLLGCDVKVAAFVASAGACEPGAGVRAAESCVAAGAHELDVVLDVDALLAGEVLRIRDDLAAVVRATRLRSMNSGRGQTLVKAVVECGRLGPQRTRLACRIVEGAGADFVAVSAAGVPLDDVLASVELVRECLPDRVGVKAVGEISSAAEAVDVLAAGAVRIGTTNAVGVVAGGVLQGAVA
ncbi:MAG TPA: deoxyribose-phosphate aldolase [Gaiellaceae bacterium]|nr:deoxyribose-phosphate aldolase [Gaiellaceae bacterium]